MMLLAAALGAAEPNLPIPLGAPAGWQRQADAQGAERRWTSPDGVAALALSVTAVAPEDGPAALARTTLEQLRSLLFNFELLDWTLDQAVGSRLWNRFHFRFTIGQRRWEQELYLTVVNGSAVAVALTAPPDAFARQVPTLHRLIEQAGVSRPMLR